MNYFEGSRIDTELLTSRNAIIIIIIIIIIIMNERIATTKYSELERRKNCFCFK